MMTKADYIIVFQGAIENGSFLTNKHHPSGVGVAYDRDRTVTVQDPSGLYDYLGTDGFTMHRYHNNSHPQSPEYLVLRPNDPAYIAGSGIPTQSAVPTHDCDRFIVVSGVKQGWHIYAEQQSRIDANAQNGQLKYLGEVT